MSYFEFPLTRTYDSDLGWLIRAMKKLIEDWENFSNMNSIKFADPITWSIARNYEPSTIVISEDGNGYISRKAVPVGVPLENEDYWTQIFNYGDTTRQIRENIAVYAGSSSTTPVALSKDQLVWWNDDLYRVLYDIAAGTAFIEGTNVERMTVDEKIDLIRAGVESTLDEFAQSITDIGDSVDTLSDDLAAEVTARENAITAEAEAREEDVKIRETSVTYRQFGAVLDGVTDDSAAVAAAHAYANTKGLRVEEHAGTLLLNFTIRLEST